MKRLTALALIATALIAVTLIFGCGSESDVPETTKATPPPAPERPRDSLVSCPAYDTFGDHADDARALHAMVEDVMQRLRYNDKSGLYELELPYLRIEKTFDDYLLHGEVSWATVEGLDHIEIKSIQFVAEDTAWINADFYLPDEDGVIQASPIEWQAVKRDDRWLKPYISTYLLQREWDEMARQAEEDSEW